MTFNPIIEATKQMLDHANEAQWDELVSLEKNRDLLIKKYFSAPKSNDKELANAIRQVLKLDSQIKHQALKERDQTGQAIKKLGQGKSAVQSYVESS